MSLPKNQLRVKAVQNGQEMTISKARYAEFPNNYEILDGEAPEVSTEKPEKFKAPTTPAVPKASGKK